MENEYGKIQKKRITCERSFDYPIDMSDDDVLDLFASQIIDAASSLFIS